MVTAPPITNDYAAANQGQVKWIASHAAAELDSRLSGGAGTAVWSKVSAFSPSNNYLAINHGQLKDLAKPFYDRLIQVGYTNAYPWSVTATDDASYAMANIGQVKRLFSMDVGLDTDLDALPDWWEIVQFGGLLAQTGSGDSDADGLLNLAEYQKGTGPNDSDTDDDGVLDGEDSNPSSRDYYFIGMSPTNGAVVYNASVLISGRLNSDPWNVSYKANGTYIGADDESYSGHITLPDGQRTLTIEAFSAGLPIARTNINITVNADPPQLFILSPASGLVTAENVRVVIQADGTNYTGTVQNKTFHRNGYLYSAWVQVNGSITALGYTIVDASGLSTNGSIPITYSPQVGYSSAADSDGDHIANGSDLFPNDPGEWADSDADGVGDNAPTPAVGWDFGPIVITWPPKGYVGK